MAKVFCPGKQLIISLLILRRCHSKTKHRHIGVESSNASVVVQAKPSGTNGSVRNFR